MSDTQNPATPVSPVPGTPEHDATQAAKFDAANQGQENITPQRPDHIPEKFWDSEKGEVRVDDLAQSYGELEKTRSTNKESSAATSQSGADQAAQALNDVGLDYNRYVDEFMTSGKLSDTAYAEMAAKNIPHSVVDAHIAVQVELAQREAETLKADVFGVVGGEEAYQGMAQWMRANMTPQEIASYNTVMDSYDIGQIKLAVQGVFAKYQATKGSEPTLIGGGTGTSQADVYRSTEQLTEDMKDPRYNRDPAFRRAVQDKLSRSSIM